MSNALHNTLHAFTQSWLGVPGWGWLALIVAVAVAVTLWALR